MCADVSELIRAVGSGSASRFDVVMARGFGPPEFTLRAAAAVLAPQGRIVISEPPEGDRWSPDLLAELGLSGRRRGAVRIFRHLTART
jgi:16S rRNA (guanine527-N7)-methyltransferase